MIAHVAGLPVEESVLALVTLGAAGIGAIAAAVTAHLPRRRRRPGA